MFDPMHEFFSLQLGRIEAKQDLIHEKLDALLDAIEADDEGPDEPQLTLDGDPMPGERDTSQPL